MAGTKGRSGRKRLSTTAHLLRGTFRPDRHRLPDPGVGAAAVDPAALVRLGEGLGEAGRQLIVEHLAEFSSWDARSRALLRTAAEAADRVAEVRAAIAADGVVRRGQRGKVTPHPLLRHERAAATQLMTALRAIEVTESGATAAWSAAG